MGLCESPPDFQFLSTTSLKSSKSVPRNNTDYTEYSFGGTAVARIRMTYFGGVPATDNAQLKTSFVQYPPFA